MKVFPVENSYSSLLKHKLTGGEEWHIKQLT